MTQASTTQNVDIEINATDEYGRPAKVAVAAARDESTGVTVEIKGPDTYELAELTVAHARELIAALAAAIEHLEG